MIAYDAYEKLAQAYSDVAEQKAENGFIEHPAMRAQLGSVRGLAVLDAGCGPGIMAGYLINSGARKVVGFDVSPSMIDLARTRTNGNAELHNADLRHRLEF
jgi:2-polyprenyl-6-hydroxyphenyl methylase/3-demethylubiquinone-9 3-methyltransferase